MISLSWCPLSQPGAYLTLWGLEFEPYVGPGAYLKNK